MNASTSFKIFDKIIKCIVKIETIVLVVSVFALTFVIMWQVICRYFLYVSTPWAEEVARYIFISMTFIGAALAITKSGHIDINIMDRVLEKKSADPEKSKIILQIVSFIATITFMTVFSFLYFLYLQKIVMRPQYSPAAQIPLLIPMGSIFTGSVLMIIQSIHMIFCAMLKLRSISVTTDQTTFLHQGGINLK